MQNGALIADVQFEKLQMNNVLIAGFVTAMNQFGLKIFPGDDELEDIVFAKHHILFQKFKVQDAEIMILNIHDKLEDHVFLKKLYQEVFWELKQKYSHAFLTNLVELSQFQGLNDRIQALLCKEHRKERLIK
ncbi:MAG: hypothetical protein Q6370_018170 [Candidatus Sigynarchaeota archaeon]